MIVFTNDDIRNSSPNVVVAWTAVLHSFHFIWPYQIADGSLLTFYSNKEMFCLTLDSTYTVGLANKLQTGVGFGAVKFGSRFCERHAMLPTVHYANLNREAPADVRYEREVHESKVTSAKVDAAAVHA